MDFFNFCIKTRWWFLVIGILTITIGIGWILLIFSIIGFVKNHSGANKNNYSLPSGFDYPDKVKKDHFLKCPVCKKGKINQDSEKTNLFRCDNCNSQFNQNGELDFKLSLKDTKEEFKDFQYVNCKFSVYEWNTITLTGKTLRENTLEQFRNGDVPNLTSAKIDSPVVLKSNEHFIWTEKSELHEPRAIRNYHGGSVRVAKGAYVHLGQSESHQEMRHIDNGTVTLTNKRIVFSGGQRSSNIELKRVMNVIIYRDGFKINIENREKPQFFAVSDPEFWNALLTGTMKRLN